jgi:hypothetical protein
MGLTEALKSSPSPASTTKGANGMVGKAKHNVKQTSANMVLMHEILVHEEEKSRKFFKSLIKQLESSRTFKLPKSSFKRKEFSGFMVS